MNMEDGFFALFDLFRWRSWQFTVGLVVGLFVLRTIVYVLNTLVDLLWK